MADAPRFLSHGGAEARAGAGASAGRPPGGLPTPAGEAACTSAATRADLQRDTELVCWPSVFLEAWGTKANKLHFFKNIIMLGPCRLRRQGPKIGTFLKKVRHPKPPKNHVANQTLRDPSETFSREPETSGRCRPSAEFSDKVVPETVVNGPTAKYSMSHVKILP